MDAQFWIYIVIVAIYFLSRMLKKTEQPGAPTADDRPERRRQGQPQTPSAEVPRQLTFEELLREITEGKKIQRPSPQPQSLPERRYQPVEREVDEEARSLEEIPEAEYDVRSPKSYEQTRRQAYQHTSLEETLKLKDTAMDFGKFKVFETQQKSILLDRYKKILRNPDTLKEAVVLSEVLKRKF
ncbi:MAG TPA: hypothetical protein VF490_10050 [Chryseosolibacter sp.]